MHVCVCVVCVHASLYIHIYIIPKFDCSIQGIIILCASVYCDGHMAEYIDLQINRWKDAWIKSRFMEDRSAHELKDEIMDGL